MDFMAVPTPSLHKTVCAQAKRQILEQKGTDLPVTFFWLFMFKILFLDLFFKVILIS